MWHKRTFIAAQVLVTLLTARAGHGAPLYFDAEGGTKPWLGSHWAADPAGPYNQPWVNGSDASLIGTAGTAIVDSPIAPSSVAIGAGYTVSLASAGSYNLLGTSSPVLTIGPGGVLRADNASNNAHNLGLVTLNGGSLSSNAVDSQYGNFILGSGVTAGGTAISTIDARSVSLRNTGGVFNVADATAGTDLLIQSNIVNHPGFDAVLTKTGAGMLELTGANTYTGPTTVDAGTLTLSDGGRLGGGSYNAPVSLGDGAVLNFNMTNSQSLGDAVAGTGTLALDTAADYLYMTGDHSAFEGTFHNLAGNMFLASSAANSPAGARARVDGGLLQLAPNGSGNGTWRIGALSGTGGAVQPNRNLAGRTITLEVGGLNTDTSYGGVLRNNTNGTPSALALTKVGTGTLTLAATNTYSGGTTVEAGVLEVAATRALGSGAIAINDGTVRLATNAYNALGQSSTNATSPAITIGLGATLAADQGGSNAHNLGPITLNGGMLTSVNGPAGPANDGNFGNFILNAGLTAGGNAVSAVSSTTLSWKEGGGTLTVAEGSQLDVSSRIHDYPGSSVPLAKQGLGTLTLMGANTYTGGTSVDAGTLLANNATGSGTGSGAVTVNTDAVLGGLGRIGGNVNITGGGSLAPGESLGTLHLGGNLTFDQNAFFDIDIDSVDLADMVQMEGGSLRPNDAAIRVDLGFSPMLGDSWIILQGEGTRDGMFNEEVLVPNGSDLLGWMRFDVSYGNSVILTVVPEPGTGLLLLAAVACGMLMRRKT